MRACTCPAVGTTRSRTAKRPATRAGTLARHISEIAARRGVLHRQLQPFEPTQSRSNGRPGPLASKVMPATRLDAAYYVMVSMSSAVASGIIIKYRVCYLDLA